MGLIVAVAACAVLCAPAVATAASGFSWSQPGDFTATGSGANPEHKYGEPSWSYSSSGGSLSYSSSFTGAGGTYAGWINPSASPTSWLGVSTSGTPSTLQMVPADGGSVSLTWTSPASSSKSVTVSGTVSEPGYTGGLPTECAGTDWTLTNGATTVASGSGASGTISPSGAVTVAGGGKLVLTVTDAAGLLNKHSAACTDTEVALSLSASPPASAITVTSPTSDQSYTTGQPTFAGAAGDGFGYEGQVTVRVYSAEPPSSEPVETLTTTESGGNWSVPASPLPNGTYAVQAEQDDVLGDVDLSTGVTFTVANPGAPTVTLNSLGSSPLTTSTPTLTGTAGTASGDSDVAIVVSDAQSGNEAAFLVAVVRSNGTFSVPVSPALADGEYTAVAYQQDSTGGLGESSSLTFTIQVKPATLTLTSPAQGASVSQRGTTFSGSAGNAVGDSTTITVTLYKGTSAKGKAYGTEKTTAQAATWSLTWPATLPLGFYTVQVSQGDGGGQTTTTSPRTFLAVPPQNTVGSTVKLTRGGTASVSVTCLAPAGDTCRGNILVLTTRSYQPVAGGPIGPVRVLFASVNLRGERTVVVRRSLNRGVARALLRHTPLNVRVTMTLTETGGKPVTSTATRKLKKA
jgi:hypothetical protein